MPRGRGSRKPNTILSGLMLVVLALGIIGSMSDNDKSSDQLARTAEPVSSGQVAPVVATNGKSDAPPTISEPNVESSTSTATSVHQATRYVRGRKVALRDGPGKQFGVLDRYDNGREVAVFETTSVWTKVRDKLTAREGWISTSLLSEIKPEDDDPALSGDDKPSKPSGGEQTKPSVPQIPETTVIQRIIAQSLSMYPGSCACPYNTDRGGRRCGKRSAYNRGGGYAPICFPGDVSKEMIQSFREQASR